MKSSDAAKEAVTKAPDVSEVEAGIKEPEASETQAESKSTASASTSNVEPEATTKPEEKEEEDMKSMEEMMTGLASVASGWLSGWAKSLEVAKYKSAEVYDMVKKDLSELSEAVQTETSSVLSDTGTMLSSTSRSLRDSLQMQDDLSAASQVKRSVSGFLTHVHKAFTPDTMQDDDAEAYILRDGQPVLLDRLQTELHRLAADPHTYLSEPAEDERLRYELWGADLDLEARQAELSDLLASNRAILDQYTTLVPAQVSHVLFWHRYLFRVHLAEEREKQREELRKRADQMSTPGAAEKQVAWEEDSEDKKDFSHHVELTDAQADKVLAEYDREVQQRSQSGSGDERPESHSPAQASSNDDDWVKEDIDGDTNTSSSVGNDWEKWD